VDEDFARYYWRRQSGLGHKLFMGSTAHADNEAFTIVGVVRSVKQAALPTKLRKARFISPTFTDQKTTFLSRHERSPAQNS
jgi:hypothetical protein